MLLGDKPFYTEVSEEPLELNITCTLVPYYDYKYADEKDFMLKNRIVGPGKWAIIKRRREYTKLNSRWIIIATPGIVVR
ncbi:MAG: hypothetical protein GTN80_00660 [Nitrososphaeria archaeon]|nr:hypothetical protein [Nitrososphaeria archaeon]NIQ32157.1 hypothetical protein [Nitrososphaeria archaeon]